MEYAVLAMKKWKAVTKLIFLCLYAPGPKSFKVFSMEVIILRSRFPLVETVAELPCLLK